MFKISFGDNQYENTGMISGREKHSNQSQGKVVTAKRMIHVCMTSQ